MGDWDKMTKDEWLAIFIKRGASVIEAEQQWILRKKYGVDTYITQDGHLGAMRDSLTAQLIDQILGDLADLAPRIRQYLEDIRSQKFGQEIVINITKT